ncbi:MAG: EamA family transporter RarD [bacterium]|nr:EamA family transporter RarD [bacterium]
MEAQNARQSHWLGFVFALLAYGSWGVLPLYWKALSHLPASEILAHRVVWALALMVASLSLSGSWPEVAAVFRDPAQRLRALATASLIGTNWMLFIWSVNNDQMVAASLGYFLTPLMNVVLGTVFLRERLSRPQLFAVVLAGAGVAVQVLRLGSLPLLALALGGSFALYGLLRKTARVGALAGLSTEALILAPFALGYIFSVEIAGNGAFANLASVGWVTMALLVGAGAVTAAPLLWFAGAARRLPLTTVGLIQYLAPSITLVLAVRLYDEDFTGTHALSFGLIWAGLLVFSGDMLRSSSPVSTSAA